MKGINALTDLLNVLANAVWNPAAFSTSTQLYVAVLQGKWQEQTLPPHPLASTVNNLPMPCMSTAISTTTTILWRFVQDYLGKPYQKKHSPTHLS